MSETVNPKEEIIEIGRLAYSQSLISGNSGNISVRHQKDRIFITRSGSHKGLLQKEDIICCDLQGEPIFNDTKSQVSSEIKLHTYIYHKRKDISAIIHTHPVYSIIASLVDIDFSKHLLPETILTLGTIKVADYGTPTTEGLVQTISEHIKSGVNNIILKRHGTLNIANSLRSALSNLEILEHVAKISIITKMLGCNNVLSVDEVEELREIKNTLFS